MWHRPGRERFRGPEPEHAFGLAEGFISARSLPLLLNSDRVLDLPVHRDVSSSPNG